MFSSGLIAAVLLALHVLLAARGEVTTIDRDYALGRGVSGRPCIGPCAAGRGYCATKFVDGKTTPERCMVLQYYNTQYYLDMPLCAGPCGKFVDPRYNSCIVNATEYVACNPRTEHEVVAGVLTWDGEPCAGPCTASRVCRTASGETAACHQEPQHYIRAHHIWDGAPCLDRCKLRSQRWTECHIAKGHLSSCAPPARFVLHAADDHNT